MGVAGEPNVSIVIVNADTLTFLQRCLATIAAAAGTLTTEVFVVDNASQDGSPQWVRQNQPDVQLISLEKNVGFARANNLALRAARGRYALLLNPDVELTPGCLAEIISYLDADPDVGICGLRLVKMDGQLDWSCRRSLPTPWNVLSRLLHLHRLFPRSPFFTAYELRHLDPGEVYDVGAVSGAFMMVRRASTDRIGLLDEQFFLYAEDIDLCARMGAAGYRTVYYGSSIAYHHKGAAVRQNPWRGVWQFHWTAWQYYRKHWSRGRGLVLKPFVFIALAGLFGWSILGNVLTPVSRRAVGSPGGTISGPRPAEALGDGDGNRS